MLTSDAPKMEPPMEAANPASSPQAGTAAGAGGEAIVVAQQPASQPRPSIDAARADMALRGGGMNHYCGFSCCKGRCNFRLC